jgi:hypothetical protein
LCRQDLNHAPEMGKVVFGNPQIDDRNLASIHALLKLHTSIDRDYYRKPSVFGG